MPEPPAPPPAPDLDAIALCAERVAGDDEVRGQDAWQLSAVQVPALVAYARTLEAEIVRLRATLDRVSDLADSECDEFYGGDGALLSKIRRVVYDALLTAP